MTISRLHRIEIFNLLSFDHQVFENIGDLGVIIGPNNSGKSNLFKILKSIRSGKLLDKKLIKFNSQKHPVKINLEFKFDRSKILEYFRDQASRLFREHSKDYLKNPKLFKFFKDNRFNPEESILLEEAFENIVYEFEVAPGSSYEIFIRRVTFKNGLISYNFVDRTSVGHEYSIRNMELSKPRKKLIANSNSFEWHFFPNSIFNTGFPNPGNQLLNNRSIFDKRVHSNPLLHFFLSPIIDFYSKMNMVVEDRSFLPFYKVEASTKPFHFEYDGENVPLKILSYNTNEKEKLEKLNHYLSKLYPNIKEINQNFLHQPDYSLYNIDYYPETNIPIEKYPLTIPYVLEEDLEYKLTFDKLGKGIQQLVTILVAILETKENGLLLIEEPELFIHPDLQKILLSIIEENLS